MTVTYQRKRRNWDGTTSQFGQISFDASYPLGGEAVVGWNGAKIKQVNIKPTATHFFLYDKVAQKIVAWTAGAEVADTTDISAIKTTFELVMA